MGATLLTQGNYRGMHQGSAGSHLGLHSSDFKKHLPNSSVGTIILSSQGRNL